MPASLSRKKLDEELRRLCAEAALATNVAVSDRQFLKAVPQKTNASSVARLPPEPVLSMFRERLARVAADFRKRNGGSTVIWDERFKMDGRQWRLTVEARVTMKTKVKGGSSYTIRKGDTLWKIAETAYGAGAYWPEVEAANRGLVKAGGKFILAGVTISLPKVIVPQRGAAPAIFDARRDLRASAPAMGVAIPDLTVSFAPKRVFRKEIPGPDCTLVVEFDVEGGLTASNSSEMPIGFDLSKYEAELKSEVEGLATSITLDAKSIRSIALSSSWGRAGSLAMRWNDDGSIAGELVQTVRGRKVGGATVSGSVTYRLTVKFVPNMKLREIGGRVRVVAYDVAEKAIYVLAGVAVVVGLGLAIKVAVATAPATGLVAASVALLAMPQGMKQITK